MATTTDSKVTLRKDDAEAGDRVLSPLDPQPWLLNSEPQVLFELVKSSTEGRRGTFHILAWDACTHFCGNPRKPLLEPQDLPTSNV